MNTYKHSVLLDSSKCNGCTSCLKHCPTEAIRIRDNLASINCARCIDCGECIRICSNKAKKASYNNFETINDYKWKIALPAPTLYGQFESLDDVDYVLNGLKQIGFDDVYEVAQAAELVTAYTRMYLKTEGIKTPVISSACPVVTRLIALRFPSLKENIIPLLPPMEIAAIEARKKAKLEHPELKDSDIGVCFISPCPAKVSYVKNGFADYKSNVDLVLSISKIYFMLLNVMKRDRSLQPMSKSGKIGVSWATTGGESSAIFNDRYLAADGIDNVIHVLDLIENGNIPQLEFIELNACRGGCVGGVMAVENPYVAKARLQTLRRFMPVSQTGNDITGYIPEDCFFNKQPEYQPINRLGSNVGESMRMMAEIQNIKETLPGIDCGACGAPTCRAFAEDVVKGNAKISDCIISMKPVLQDYLENRDKTE